MHGTVKEKGKPEGLPYPASLLPEKQGPWHLASVPEQVDASGLYSLIDGGAEVYLELGIRAAATARYAARGLPDIVADVYWMNDPEAAFGAYHHDMREGDSAGVGAESEFDRGVLHFWKGSFFCSVTAVGHSQKAERAVLGLGRKMAEAIDEKSPMPWFVAALPPGEFDRRRLHYFKGPRLIARKLPVAPGSPLGRCKGCRGIVAAGRRGTILLLLAKTSREAAAIARWLEANKGSNIAVDGARLVPAAAGYAGCAVAAIFDSGDGKWARETVRRVLERHGREVRCPAGK